MTGWRLGYAAAPQPIIQSMNRVHQYAVSCASAFAQAGAVAALTGPQTCVSEMVAEFKRRRDLVVSAINGTGALACLEPGGAFYVWVNIQSTGISAEEFSMRLLEREYVSLVPGPVFGASGQGYVRISYANSYTRLEEAMRRLAKFCA
jgi:aspartate/methionine/tyrosine aminotransferase